MLLTIGSLGAVHGSAADAKRIQECMQSNHYLCGRSQSHAHGVAHLQANLEFARVSMP